ncbi:LRR receptor kinase SERK2 [Ricinus communis]|uniref:ATP binding protein, putative n=1 Tax=Ricinus communis TaxID=3988 RepID=B9T6A3_RICCO|nr:LRR receptor kinase SERK2 [Ricinus communis]EEF28617.1 ATP binding protein, putative [Ricinus communis]|eukprot:XP_002533772.1 LRR receptor kinase SERK2 [Ricinus communis]
MASTSASSLLLFILVSVLVSSALPATVVEDLANLKPPPDFNSTLKKNCLHNPSHRYCNSSPIDLNDIFKSTIVASHLCNESKNPNCVESFPKIDLRNRPKIVPLYLSYNFFWKYCPLSILSIDLSNNSLKGGFPMDVLLCTQIQALDLSVNSLIGDVPVESFGPLANLTFLNLSYNYFSESRMSDSQFFKRFNASSFVHSGLNPSHKNYKMKAIFLLVGFPISVILMVVCFGWLCFLRPDYLPKILQRKHRFTPAMIRAATNRFSRKNLVVKGEGVEMYKGSLRDGTKVRIEIYLDNISREDRRKFIEECKVLVQLSHKNLVQVVGWCGDRELRAIIAEWTEGNNVEMWLSGSAPTWKQRLKILMGVVEGMCYLQEQWPDVGFDLRTSSVLLSENLDPLISRFKVGAKNSNTKNIYKYGIFLLEMITNKRPQEDFETGEAGFIGYIRMSYPENLRKVIDARMKLSENMIDQAKHGIGLGLMCTDQSTSKYPSLNQIFSMLARVYQSCLVLASQGHGTAHGDGAKGHSRAPPK